MTALALSVATAVGYYRKVTVPQYLAQQQRRLQLADSDAEQPVRRLPESPSSDRMPLAA